MKLHLPVSLLSILLLTLPIQAVTSYNAYNGSVSGSHSSGLEATNGSELTTTGLTDITRDEQSKDVVKLDNSSLTNASFGTLSVSGTAPFIDGIYATNASTVTNQGSLTISTDGQSNNANGIYLNSNSSLSNDAAQGGGTAKLSVTATSNGGQTFGLRVEGGGSVTNAGTMTILSDNESTSAYGIYGSKTTLDNKKDATLDVTAQGIGSAVTTGIKLDNKSGVNNDGTIISTAENTTSTGAASALDLGTEAATSLVNGAGNTKASMQLIATAMKNATGFTLGKGWELTNYGSLTATATTQGSATSTYAHGAMAYGTLTNKGSMSFNASGQGSATALHQYGAALTNESTASVTVDASGYSATGIYIAQDTGYGKPQTAGLTNKGSVTIEATGVGTGNTAKGMQIAYLSVLSNETKAKLNITATGDNAYGIHFLSGSTMENKGTATVTAHSQTENGVAYAITADSSTLTNKQGATLSASAQGGTNNADIILRSGTFYQAGTLKADKVNLRGSTVASALHLLDGSTSGAHEAGGTMHIVSDNNSGVIIGNALNETGTPSETPNGSMVSISSALSITGGKLQLQDEVSVELSGDLSLTNVTVTGLGYLSSANDTPITLNAEGVTFVIDAGNSVIFDLPSPLSSGDPLTETQVSPKTLTIATPLLDGINVEGNITLDLSYWAEEIEAGGYDNIAFTLGNDVSFAQGSTITATLGDENILGTTTATDGTVNFNRNGAVPEPTTATLSLLALAALAARRRRS